MPDGTKGGWLTPVAPTDIADPKVTPISRAVPLGTSAAPGLEPGKTPASGSMKSTYDEVLERGRNVARRMAGDAMGEARKGTISDLPMTVKEAPPATRYYNPRKQNNANIPFLKYRGSGTQEPSGEQ